MDAGPGRGHGHLDKYPSGRFAHQARRARHRGKRRDLFTRLWLGGLVLVTGAFAVTAYHSLTRRFLRSIFAVVFLAGLFVWLGLAGPAASWDWLPFFAQLNHPAPTWSTTYENAQIGYESAQVGTYYSSASGSSGKSGNDSSECTATSKLMSPTGPTPGCSCVVPSGQRQVCPRAEAPSAIPSGSPRRIHGLPDRGIHVDPRTQIRDGQWVAHDPDWLAHTTLAFVPFHGVARFIREVKTDKFMLLPSPRDEVPDRERIRLPVPASRPDRT